MMCQSEMAVSHLRHSAVHVASAFAAASPRVYHWMTHASDSEYAHPIEVEGESDRLLFRHPRLSPLLFVSCGDREIVDRGGSELWRKEA